MLLVALTAAGCIGDSLTDCSVRNTLIVRAYDADGSDLTNTITDVSLYVFDNDGLFVERVETTVGTQVNVYVPVGEQITIAGWANASGTNDLFPDITPGVDHIDDCSVGLRAATRSAATHYDSPDDMFQGAITITAEELQNEHILPITRKTGGMSVTLRKLRENLQCDCDDITVVVRETATAVGFDGGLQGSRTATYSVSGTFNEHGDFTTGIFRMLPDTEGLTIEIYHSGELIRTVNVCSGEPITLTAGRTTNLLIDFSLQVGVRVSLTNWNVLEIWRDF